MVCSLGISGEPRILHKYGMGSRGELLAEPLDAAGRVDKLLLPGKKRMAGAANIDRDSRPRAARDERISARTVNVADLILGMNLGLHDQTPCPDVRAAKIAARQPEPNIIGTAKTEHTREPKRGEKHTA